MLNTIVAESLDFVATELEANLKGGKNLDEAVKLLLTKLIKENKRIIFNGDNYTEEWHEGSRASAACPTTGRRWTPTARP